MAGFTELPKFVVIPDSNCLFTPDEREVVSQAFTELFRELKKKCDVQLAIPEIVFEELLSQKVFRCETLLKKANPACDQLKR